MTAQIMELITLDGKEFGMQSEPEIPSSHEMIKLLSGIPEGLDKYIGSSACWRRYHAHWAVQDDFLYLIEVQGIYQKVTPHPIRAEWFTGELCAVEGNILDYVHLEYASTYEFEHRLKFENGRLVERQLIDNRGKKLPIPEDIEQVRQEHEEWIQSIRRQMKTLSKKP